MKYANSSLFKKFQSHFPFCCIDLILVKEKKFLLVKRTISPYKNKLCLPGGIIRKGEKLNSAIKRIGVDEIGVYLEAIRPIGFYEKIYHDRHDITHCFLVRIKKGTVKLNYQAEHAKFYSKIPKSTASFFKEMLKDAGFS